MNQDLKEIADKENTSVESIIETAVSDYCLEELARGVTINSVDQVTRIIANHYNKHHHRAALSSEDNTVLVSLQLDLELAIKVGLIADGNNVDAVRVLRLALHWFYGRELERGEA